MVRKGYIYVIHYGKVVNRCPIVYLNKEYIYFIYNGDKELHFIRQQQNNLITLDELVEKSKNDPSFAKYCWYVSVTNEEVFNFNYKYDELNGLDEEILCYQNTIKQCEDAIKYNDRKIKEHKDYNDKINNNIKGYLEKLESLKKERQEIIAQRSENNGG